jgi:hypothetical protein
MNLAVEKAANGVEELNQSHYNRTQKGRQATHKSKIGVPLTMRKQSSTWLAC